MPELPEVETVKLGLHQHVTGKTVVQAEVVTPVVIKEPTIEEFGKIITGKTFLSVERRGKYLVLHLSDGYSMIVHLRMTGRFVYCPPDFAGDTPVFILTLDDGCQLRLSTRRKFTVCHLLPTEQVESFPGLVKLGLEPFSSEFTVDNLSAALQGRKGKIKSLLLNQQLIAGIGNIYADEILFAVGIRPDRTADSLTPEEIAKLHAVVISELRLGIEHGGTTINNYVHTDNEKGRHQDFLKVYGQAEKPCTVCGMPISKIKLGGRGTCFCSHCQK